MGVSVYLGEIGSEICPVADYLQVRCPDPGLFFLFQSDKPLTQLVLVHGLLEAFQYESIPANNYNEHSFRTGAATTAACCGLEDSLIQTLGR